MRNRTLVDCLDMVCHHHCDGDKFHMIITAPGTNVLEALKVRCEMINQNVSAAIHRINEIETAAKAGKLDEVLRLLDEASVPANS